MTYAQTDLDVLKMHLRIRNKIYRTRLSKVRANRHTQTDATECITRPHSRVVNPIPKYFSGVLQNPRLYAHLGTRQNSVDAYSDSAMLLPFLIISCLFLALSF